MVNRGGTENERRIRGRVIMSTYEADHTSGQRRFQRLWIVETLVVLGVLAFGYFAVTMDSSLFGAAPAPVEVLDPIAELTR
jgi:hypothetical protein